MEYEGQKASEDELRNKYQKHFNRNAAYKLLKKLRRYTRKKPALLSGPVGTIVTILGKLLSALDSQNTPAPMKALIIGAIGYIILPLDLVPDFIPVFGYLDDIATASGVVVMVETYSTFKLEDLDAELDSEGY
ncbi:hypothetical protein FACS1894130_10040 [Spirochaetia bacterium]|nr:hypothetical protein FACS1894130_10040 [Spirochaetia bacterium]